MAIYEKIFKQHGLSKTQQEIIKLVGENKTILEVGASTGYMTKFFLKNNCTVDVVEIDKRVLKKLPKGVRKVLNISIEDKKIKRLISKKYDFIIMADVLEHLISPTEALAILYKISSKKTTLIISMPNIASWVMRKQLFFKGDFEYQQSGILDKTHLHFYTPKTLKKLLLENAWEVRSTVGTMTRIPIEGFINKLPLINSLFEKIFYPKLVKKFPNLSFYHFYVTAVKK